jgi:glycosyltransferase involved in cell wall biosynthesis
MFHSNAQYACTGYGKQTKLFATRIAKLLGRKVGVSAFAGLRFARLELDGIPTYPGGRDRHGNDVLEMHARDFFGGDQRDGIVIPLTDIWVLWTAVLKRLRVAAWVPVDHQPCQPPTVEVMREAGVLPIAMSRFGERMLIDEGFSPVYVPHGCETEIFRPAVDRAACRRALKLPESAYLVGMVAANMGQRKSFPQAIRAFARFRESHPDAFLYLHTWLGPEYDGLDLRTLIKQELDNKGIFVCEQYAYDTGLNDDSMLAVVYNALDLLMNPAQGEGFGVCLIEAQACGTPVLLTNFSSMPELCGAGYLVGGTPVYTTFKSWQLLPSVDELVAALELDYGLTMGERLEMRQRAREFALPYDADTVTHEYWAPALAEIAERLPRKQRPVPPRAKARAKRQKVARSR